MHKKTLVEGFNYSNDFCYLKINITKTKLENIESIYRALI